MKKKMKKSNGKIKQVVSHLKGDMKTFKKEREEDKELIHELKESPKMERKEERKEKKSKKPKKAMKTKRAKSPKSSKLKMKMKKVSNEFKEGKLHSGSKKGPVVTNPKQMVAIAYSEARRTKNKKRK